ncbi:hypothetical protein TTHERM_00317150 (macronuclear) [Tetrahymena thermophila SB210]|uniref:Uncharacterized protein n=1 Tax=Tetrahymena thermophila (strain SB210) TaxID=312017 RepID=I7MG68_TETTS|nr:hypothetical protein TTHERM_00317150 [Tetrahymena thermophila SB210]EAS01151.1 hypothetical protein TTHERM_00317150 [Tetrahymena thermophila SB210]|eukprot:XP_001021396.1 hypothetical protein TTHERM_00317150 [Tetrahymena thermophila SB210]
MIKNIIIIIIILKQIQYFSTQNNLNLLRIKIIQVDLTVQINQKLTNKNSFIFILNSNLIEDLKEDSNMVVA